jgi:hypothetical protein
MKTIGRHVFASLWGVGTILLACLSATSLHAQTRLVLTVPSVPAGEDCFDITGETINGQPFDSSGGKFSPLGGSCGTFDQGLAIILPPQPFTAPYDSWFTMAVPASQVTHGAYVQNVNAHGQPIPNSFSRTDTFYYNDPSNPQTIGDWVGKVVGQYIKSIFCYRGGCVTRYTPQSYVITMTQ